MRIHADPGAIKRTSWKEYTMRFVFGGLVAVLAGAVGKHYGPVMGGLFLAFPAIFPASATLIEKHEAEKEKKSGASGDKRGAEASGVDAAGTAIGSMGLMAFGLVVWLCAPRLGAFGTLSIALAAWVVVSLGAWAVRQRM